jgi:hypothetical protein
MQVRFVGVSRVADKAEGLARLYLTTNPHANAVAQKVRDQHFDAATRNEHMVTRQLRSIRIACGDCHVRPVVGDAYDGSGTWGSNRLSVNEVIRRVCGYEARGAPTEGIELDKIDAIALPSPWGEPGRGLERGHMCIDQRLATTTNDQIEAGLKRTGHVEHLGLGKVARRDRQSGKAAAYNGEQPRNDQAAYSAQLTS